jgi:hypothetical protein
MVLTFREGHKAIHVLELLHILQRRRSHYQNGQQILHEIPVCMYVYVCMYVLYTYMCICVCMSAEWTTNSAQILHKFCTYPPSGLQKSLDLGLMTSSFLKKREMNTMLAARPLSMHAARVYMCSGVSEKECDTPPPYTPPPPPFPPPPPYTPFPTTLVQL